MKNKITNVIAFAVVILGAVKEAIAVSTGESINWWSVAGTVAVAIVAWFTGKPNK